MMGSAMQVHGAGAVPGGGLLAGVGRVRFRGHALGALLGRHALRGMLASV
jgi:hypothetical protein